MLTGMELAQDQGANLCARTQRLTLQGPLWLHPSRPSHPSPQRNWSLGMPYISLATHVAAEATSHLLVNGGHGRGVFPCANAIDISPRGPMTSLASQCTGSAGPPSHWVPRYIASRFPRARDRPRHGSAGTIHLTLPRCTSKTGAISDGRIMQQTVDGVAGGVTISTTTELK